MKLTTSTPFVRRTTLAMIMIGLATVILTTLPTVRLSFGWPLGVIGFFNAGYFTVEYIFRLIEFHRKGRKALLHYLFSFMGLVDLITVFPFILPVLFPVDSSLVTVMIYCRLLLIFKLRRYSRSFDMLSATINTVRKPLLVAISLPLMVAMVSALFFYYVEAPLQPGKLQNIGDAFYWVIITMTTVGYGDITPLSEVGQMLAVLTALSGVLVIAIPSGILSSAFINLVRNQGSKPEKYKLYPYSRSAHTRVDPSIQFKRVCRK